LRGDLAGRFSRGCWGEVFGRFGCRGSSAGLGAGGFWCRCRWCLLGDAGEGPVWGVLACGEAYGGCAGAAACGSEGDGEVGFACCGGRDGIDAAVSGYRGDLGVYVGGIAAGNGVGIVFGEVIRSVNHQSPLSAHLQTGRRGVDDIGIRAHSHRYSAAGAVVALEGVGHGEAGRTRHILRSDSERTAAAGMRYRLQLNGVNAGGVLAGDCVAAGVGFNGIARHINSDDAVLSHRERRRRSGESDSRSRADCDGEHCVFGVAAVRSQRHSEAGSTLLRLGQCAKVRLMPTLSVGAVNWISEATPTSMVMLRVEVAPPLET